jgi:hypothetical protein
MLIDSNSLQLSGEGAAGQLEPSLGCCPQTLGTLGLQAEPELCWGPGFAEILGLMSSPGALETLGGAWSPYFTSEAR